LTFRELKLLGNEGRADNPIPSIYNSYKFEGNMGRKFGEVPLIFKLNRTAGRIGVTLMGL
jgi:hypothetical protein